MIAWIICALLRHGECYCNRQIRWIFGAYTRSNGSGRAREAQTFVRFSLYFRRFHFRTLQGVSALGDHFSKRGRCRLTAMNKVSPSMIRWRPRGYDIFRAILWYRNHIIGIWTRHRNWVFVRPNLADSDGVSQEILSVGAQKEAISEVETREIVNVLF